MGDREITQLLSKVICTLLALTLTFPATLFANAAFPDAPQKAISAEEAQQKIDNFAVAQSAEKELIPLEMADNGSLGNDVRIVVVEGEEVCEPIDGQDIMKGNGKKCFSKTRYQFNDSRVDEVSKDKDGNIIEPLNYGEKIAYGYLSAIQKVLSEIYLEGRLDLLKRSVNDYGLNMHLDEEGNPLPINSATLRTTMSDLFMPSETWFALRDNFSINTHPDLWQNIEEINLLSKKTPTVDQHELAELIDVAFELAELDRMINSFRQRPKMNWDPKKFLGMVYKRRPGKPPRFAKFIEELTPEQRALNQLADMLEEEKYNLYPEFRFLFMQLSLSEYSKENRPSWSFVKSIHNLSNRGGKPTLYAIIAAKVMEELGVSEKDFILGNWQSLNLNPNKISSKIKQNVRGLLQTGISYYLTEHNFALQKIVSVKHDQPRDFIEEFFQFAPVFMAKTGLRQELEKRYLIPRHAQNKLQKIIESEYKAWEAAMIERQKKKDINHGLLMAATSFGLSMWAVAKLSVRLGRTVWAARLAEAGTALGRFLTNYSRLKRIAFWSGALMILGGAVEMVWFTYSMYPDYVALRDFKRMFNSIFFMSSNLHQGFSSKLTLADLDRARVLSAAAFRRIIFAGLMMGVMTIPAISGGIGLAIKGAKRFRYAYFTVDEQLIERLAGEINMVTESVATVDRRLDLASLLTKARSAGEKSAISSIAQAGRRADQILDQVRAMYPEFYATTSTPISQTITLSENMPKAEVLQYMIDKLQDLRVANKVWRNRLGKALKRLQAQRLGGGSQIEITKRLDEIGEIRAVLGKIQDYYKNLQLSLRRLPINGADTRYVNFLTRIFRKVFRSGKTVEAAGASGIVNTPLASTTVPMEMAVGAPVEGKIAKLFNKVSPGSWDKIKAIWQTSKTNAGNWAHFRFAWEDKMIDGANAGMLKRGWNFQLSRGMFGRVIQKNLVNTAVSYLFDRNVMVKNKEQWEKYGKKIWYMNVGIGVMHGLMNMGVTMSNLTFFERPFARGVTTSLVGITGVIGANALFFSQDEDVDNPFAELLNSKCANQISKRIALNLFWTFPNDPLDVGVNSIITALENIGRRNMVSAVAKNVVIAVDKTVLGPWAWKFISNKVDAEGLCETEQGILDKVAEIEPDDYQAAKLNESLNPSTAEEAAAIPQSQQEAALMQMLALKHTPPGWVPASQSHLVDISSWEVDEEAKKRKVVKVSKQQPLKVAPVKLTAASQTKNLGFSLSTN